MIKKLCKPKIGGKIMKPTLTNLKPTTISNPTNQVQIKDIQEDVVSLSPKINYQEDKNF